MKTLSNFLFSQEWLLFAHSWSDEQHLAWLEIFMPLKMLFISINFIGDSNTLLISISYTGCVCKIQMGKIALRRRSTKNTKQTNTKYKKMKYKILEVWNENGLKLLPVDMDHSAAEKYVLWQFVLRIMECVMRIHFHK